MREKGWEANPTITTTAVALISSYGNVPTGDVMYKNKEITVTDARVESIDGVVVLAVPTIKGQKADKKIRVHFDSDLQAMFTNLRVGGTVKIKGKCKGLDDGDILIEDAWFAP